MIAPQAILLPPAPIHLSTERLTVRSLTRADLSTLYPHYSDAETMRFIPQIRWHSADDADAWLLRTQASEAEGKARPLVITRRDESEVIGAVLLFNMDAGDERAELGYILGRQHWGCGYAAEAVSAVIDFVFSELKLRRLEAMINPDNSASFTLAQRLGFQLEGTLRERHQFQGVPYSMSWYSLLAHEWQSRKLTHLT